MIIRDIKNSCKFIYLKIENLKLKIIIAYPGEATNRNSLDFMVASSATRRRGGAIAYPG